MVNEKLWRKFDSDEAGEELLACKLKVFDKLKMIDTIIEEKYLIKKYMKIIQEVQFIIYYLKMLMRN